MSSFDFNPTKEQKKRFEEHRALRKSNEHTTMILKLNSILKKLDDLDKKIEKLERR